jgi:hypothetical protein
VDEYSRPLASALALGQAANDAHRFIHKRVLLTGEPPVVETDNGRTCLEASLRLLIRICPNLTIRLPEREGLEQDCRRVLDETGSVRTAVVFEPSSTDFHGFDAVLAVGTTARSDLPWTVVNSNGWLARVSSLGTDLDGDCSQTNPIGALAAACLGTSEVFKRLIVLQAKRAEYFDGLRFSLFTYREDSDPGPRIPALPQSTLFLVGAGAIGNGVVYLLGQLGIEGTLLIADPQRYSRGNWGTSILLGPSGFRRSKAKVLAEAIDGSLVAMGFQKTVEEVSEKLGTSLPFPTIVLGAVDSLDARHAIQDLWPDLVIDGATGDFPCQISRHPWDREIACLRCLFRRPDGPPAELVASRATGLSSTRARDELSLVTQDDIDAAPADRRVWLRKRLGRQVCAVVQEAVARQISAEVQGEGFQPSVPFVACFAASMIATELVKALAGWESSLAPRFQCDILRGPQYGLSLEQSRRPDCLCTTRRRNIDMVRRDRLVLARIP